MKAALITIVVILCAVLIGWITFDTGNDRTSVNIETQEIKEDTKEAVRKGKALVNEAKREIEEESQPVID